MVETQVLNAERRTDSGTRASRKLRKEGLIPAIIYGHKQEPVAVKMNYHDLKLEIQHHHRLLKVALDGETEQFLVKAVQYDHFGEEVLHVDLTRVDMDERVTMTVQLELRGTPAGHADGGVLDQNLADIEVECPVTGIPERIRAMVTELQIGDTLKAGDLELPEGVTLVTEADTPVASVRVIAEVVEEEEIAEPTDSSEPEVIGGKPGEEEQEEGSES